MAWSKTIDSSGMIRIRREEQIDGVVDIGDDDDDDDDDGKRELKKTKNNQNVPNNTQTPN